MASTKRYINKNGEVVSIQIRVFRGEDENGKTLNPFQKSVKVPKGSTERQIQKLEQEQSVLFERECREGIASCSRVLFRDFAKEAMELKRVEGIEASTLDRYQDILDSRLIPYFGHVKVRDITGSMLNRFYREMLQPGQNRKTGGSLSRKTVLEYHRLMSTIFTLAKKQHIISSNPAEDATPPKAPKTPPTYYQPEELSKIKIAFDAEPPKWKMLGYLCMLYGDRRSEFAGIRRSCIDFTSHCIRLQGTVLYHPRRGVYEKAYPKNEKGRLLPMSSDVEAILKEYLVWLDSEIEKWGDQWTDTDYIFCGERGGIINPDTITKHFAYMTKKWKKMDPTFPHINPHAFRHTVVSLLLHNGVDKISVADFVGDDPATLDRYYAHLISAGRVQAANTMNSILGLGLTE